MLFPSHSPLYAEVILPLALRQSYTYLVPPELAEELAVGMRVEAQFGEKKIYAAVVSMLHHNQPNFETKPILSVLDTVPVVTTKQLEYWRWLANYYCCTLGDVLAAALPAGLKMTSETKFVLKKRMLDEDDEETTLTIGEEEENPKTSSVENDDTEAFELKNAALLKNSKAYKEGLILEALHNRQELTVEDVQKLLGQKSVLQLLKSLLESGQIVVHEETRERYKPRTESFVRLASPYAEDPTTLQTAFGLIPKNAGRQAEALMAMLTLVRQYPDGEVPMKKLCEHAKVDTVVINKLEEKAIFDIFKKEVSRLRKHDGEEGALRNLKLSEEQELARKTIYEQWQTKDVVLLRGVTGSGKTQVYVELIREVISEGKQVLYLLPEIALTTQMVHRLRKYFGDDMMVYHSKFNDPERVEIWKATPQKPILVGARSSLFLPFENIGLIIVDEEHDPSYKQNDPAPRYHGRDAAIYLAQTFGAKVLLGSATPSVETWFNVKGNKYGLASLMNRFGGGMMPVVQVVDTSEETKKRRMKQQFSELFLEALKETLARGEQAIVFQNRRGYAPAMRCNTCAWVAPCKHCDVSMTYHKHSQDLHCHYCGYVEDLPQSCPACGSAYLRVQGFGTERLEDDLKTYLPEARIARMDYDTVRGKYAHEQMLRAFEDKEIDILVGTQMVTKGLDFENLSLVGVPSADALLHYPDFRASERAFQMLVQVSGRAGRRDKQGLVMIQSYKHRHPVIQDAMKGDYENFVERELAERYQFNYPPYSRLIRVEFSHKSQEVVAAAAKFFAEQIQSALSAYMLGPSEPSVGRVRGFFLQHLLLKLERRKDVLLLAKQLLAQAEFVLSKQKGIGQTRVTVDVDPV